MSSKDSTPGARDQNAENGVDKIFQNVRKSLTATSLVTSAAALLPSGSPAWVLWALADTRIVQGQMTTGDFNFLPSTTLFLGFMIAPIVQMSNIGAQLTEKLSRGLDRTEEADEHNARRRWQHPPHPIAHTARKHPFR